MEETLIVIMLKEKETGFFCKELCSVSVTEFEGFLQNINGEHTEDGKILLNMLITTNRDVLDWEYNAILDTYETDTILNLDGIISVDEIEESFNPTWSVKFLYDENMRDDELEEFLGKVLEVHSKELTETFNTIIDLEEEYNEE